MVATIIILLLFALELGATLVKHGEPKEGKVNFWISLLWYGILIFLLYKAGLFDVLMK